jgi:mRNA interferase HigB
LTAGAVFRRGKASAAIAKRDGWSCPYRDLRLLFLLGVVALADRWCVRVISKRRLREFWQARKSDAASAQRDLSVWYKLAKNADWDNFAALRQTFGSADQVGNCVVFDVGNNRFRLIGRVNYRRGIIYVLGVMDHIEYDKKRWVDDCGCHKPPPKKPAVAKKPSPKGKPASRGGTGRR